MPERIVLVGLGGIGSQLVPSLVRYLALRPQPRPTLVLVDGDAYEPGNRARQVFPERAIGTNKAEALADVYRGGLTIQAVADYLTEANVATVIREAGSACRDSKRNSASRSTCRSGCAASSIADSVFTDEFGEPLTGSRITERRLRPLLRREGLPPIRFHDLRHTAATLMLTAGVNPKVVSEMLGHTSVAITLDRYSHVMPTMQAEAVRRLDGVLSGRLRVQMRVRRIPRPRKSPDSRSESGPGVQIGTAYRIPGETSHVSQRRPASTPKRRMRRKKREP